MDKAEARVRADALRIPLMSIGWLPPTGANQADLVAAGWLPPHRVERLREVAELGFDVNCDAEGVACIVGKILDGEDPLSGG